MMQEKYETLVSGTTKIIGLLGRNISYTLSPPMHNTLFKRMGLDFVYVPTPVEPPYLTDAINGMKALHFAGANVTIPYKEVVIPLLDWISEDAKTIGAVNTLKIDEDLALQGYNTDVYGFLESLKEELDCTPAERHIVIIGAGGAGRAIATGCTLETARRIVLVDIDVRHVERLCRDLDKIKQHTEIEGFYAGDIETLRKEIKKADIIINASPIGMKPDDKPPVPLDGLSKQAAVYDAIYAVRETATMREACRLGCTRLANGLGMLVHQGARAFSIWTGKQADSTLMREVVESFVYSR